MPVGATKAPVVVVVAVLFEHEVWFPAAVLVGMGHELDSGISHVALDW